MVVQRSIERENLAQQCGIDNGPDGDEQGPIASRRESPGRQRASGTTVLRRSGKASAAAAATRA